MTRQGRPKTLCTNRPWQELAWIDCQKEFFVVNTTVLSNKMYRDNPLAFWSETADNSLNWKLQPELNYPELPWKLQTTKLNYNYLEYRSKTAGNSLFVYIFFIWQLMSSSRFGLSFRFIGLDLTRFDGFYEVFGYQTDSQDMHIK